MFICPTTRFQHKNIFIGPPGLEFIHAVVSMVYGVPNFSTQFPDWRDAPVGALSLLQFVCDTTVSQTLCAQLLHPISGRLSHCSDSMIGAGSVGYTEDYLSEPGDHVVLAIVRKPLDGTPF